MKSTSLSSLDTLVAVLSYINTAKFTLKSAKLHMSKN